MDIYSKVQINWTRVFKRVLNFNPSENIEPALLGYSQVVMGQKWQFGRELAEALKGSIEYFDST